MNVYTCVISQPQQKSLKLPCLVEVSEELATKAENLTQTQDRPEVYLDPEKRYRLVSDRDIEQLKPFTKIGEKQFYALSVIDSRPPQKPYLDTSLETVEALDRDSLVSAGIPSLAFPYLTLAEFCPTIPELFDAWHLAQTHQEFVIITQADKWQSLSQRLEENNSITWPQMFGYLDQMASLWEGLSKVHCCQTLLEETNLGIDEDDTLFIKQLYPDDTENSPQLPQLVEIWLSLLEKMNREEENLLIPLLDLINEGKIENIKQLRSRIQTFSQEVDQGSSLPEEKDDVLLVTLPEELEALSAQFDFDETDIDENEEDEEATVVHGDIDDQPTVVLPMRLLNINDAGFTDIGRIRNHNEDCFAIETRIYKQESPRGTKYDGRGIYIVCDGMGGHAAGEVASAMAVKTLKQYFQQHWQDELPDKEKIKQGILQANQAIYNTNVEKGNIGSQRMGTTLVMTLIQGTKVAIAYVGDSRIYRVTRKWGLEQLTVDHCVAQAEIKHGVEAKTAFARADAFQLTQALGPRDDNFVHPDITLMDIKEDTLLLLCSDGLCDNQLLENNWQTYLSPLISSKTNLDEGLIQLIDLANQVNGHDNITGVLIRIKVQPNLESQRPFFS